MTYGDLVSHVKFDMERDSPFSYACHACNRCCRNKAIRVSPYEILRLARYLCISTTQFIENHTEAGGTVLRSTENGDCGFLGERGCSVHPDRPLACRIYPLARWVSPDGDESFGHLTPHPKTEGVYGISGTVQDYLDHQQLAPFFEMSERYGKLYQKMVDMLEKLDPEELDRRSDRRAAIDELPAGTLASMWVDIEAAIADTKSKYRDVSIEEAVDLHVAAIEAWIGTLEARWAGAHSASGLIAFDIIM
jgi:Fe-S-cluster containining protein